LKIEVMTMWLLVACFVLVVALLNDPVGGESSVAIEKRIRRRSLIGYAIMLILTRVSADLLLSKSPFAFASIVTTTVALAFSVLEGSGRRLPWLRRG
jgi:hypothetical protein